MSCKFSADTLETPSRVHRRSSSRLSSPGSAPAKRDSRGLRSSLPKVLVAASISVLRVSSVASVCCFLLLFPDMVFWWEEDRFWRLMGVSEALAIFGGPILGYMWVVCDYTPTLVLSRTLDCSFESTAAFWTRACAGISAVCLFLMIWSPRIFIVFQYNIGWSIRILKRSIEFTTANLAPCTNWLIHHKKPLTSQPFMFLRSFSCDICSCLLIWRCRGWQITATVASACLSAACAYSSAPWRVSWQAWLPCRVWGS